MRRVTFLFIALLSAACLLSFGQNTAPRLLVRVDDMGSTHSAKVKKAIDELGIILVGYGDLLNVDLTLKE